ncbi:MAG: hypothetical protein AAFR11_09480 [Pseudomonadota bacterium]
MMLAPRKEDYGRVAFMTMTALIAVLALRALIILSNLNVLVNGAGFFDWALSPGEDPCESGQPWGLYGAIAGAAAALWAVSVFPASRFIPHQADAAAV